MPTRKLGSLELIFQEGLGWVGFVEVCLLGLFVFKPWGPGAGAGRGFMVPGIRYRGVEGG